MPEDFFVIAHNVRSLFNVGSIFRTADAFAVSRLFLTGYSPTPERAEHRLKIAKVALGAESTVPWEHHRSAAGVIGTLRKRHPKLSVVALENNVRSTRLSRFKPHFPLALVLGEERGGIKRSLLAQCDRVVEIPMRGAKESLNVSVAFGVAAYVIREGK